MIINEYTNLKLHGLHAHIGSQIFETSIYADEIDILCREISRLDEKYAVKLDEINIGGGLGVKYTKEDNPPSIEEFADAITSALDKFSKKPTIYIEPGRSIISPSTVTLYTIGSSKQVPEGRKYTAIDGGMADNLRPSLLIVRG